MSSYHDDNGLPDGAFTESERAAGVPGIMRGGGSSRRWREALLTVVNERDCIDLIVRSIVMQDMDQHFLHVFDPEDDNNGSDSDIGNFAGLSFSNVHESRVILYADRHPIPAPMLLHSLRKTRLPLFIKPYNGHGLWPWLAWDDKTRDLDTNIFDKNRGFSTGFFKHQCPDEPERAQVFKLLRKWYLLSEHGCKPILVHNRHLDDALAKRSVPFENLSEGFQDDRDFRKVLGDLDPGEIDEFALVYFTPSGDVTSLPLSRACKEQVTISTRTESYFCHGAGDYHPTLVENVLWANSFRICALHNPELFHYYLKRNKGTVFQSAFERVDVPPDMLFNTCDPDLLANKASKMTGWAGENNAEIYITVGAQPLEFNECQHITTPLYYANAVKRLHDYGFGIKYGRFPQTASVQMYFRSNFAWVNSKSGPYAERWKPGTQ